jgi:hypothetical protein
MYKANIWLSQTNQWPFTEPVYHINTELTPYYHVKQAFFALKTLDFGLIP